MATADITISMPSGMQVVGYSDSVVSASGGKYHFIQSKPALIGNFAYGKFAPKTRRFGDFEIQFYTRPGNDALVDQYAETLGNSLDFYAKKYGKPDMGNKLIVTQIDDESLDFYSAEGMLFISAKEFERQP